MIAGAVRHFITFVAVIKITNQCPHAHEEATHKLSAWFDPRDWLALPIFSGFLPIPKGFKTPYKPPVESIECMMPFLHTLEMLHQHEYQEIPYDCRPSNKN